ncbi:hypothetical protein H4R18_003095 [Coemansia javaensis]|uniref:Transcription factor TFIIB cyclin-like domain-containing protein n=1 Tax=Coemansia javaensis TaxID=2761396 RepID=A0A9W8HA58_9FUNG|nr:hypothetical protein H4R18_003095 [Coemansia javaensis]
MHINALLNPEAPLSHLPAKRPHYPTDSPLSHPPAKRPRYSVGHAAPHHYPSALQQAVQRKASLGGGATTERRVYVSREQAVGYVARGRGKSNNYIEMQQPKDSGELDFVDPMAAVAAELMELSAPRGPRDMLAGLPHDVNAVLSIENYPDPYRRDRVYYDEDDSSDSDNDDDKYLPEVTDCESDAETEPAPATPQSACANPDPDPMLWAAESQAAESKAIMSRMAARRSMQNLAALAAEPPTVAPVAKKAAKRRPAKGKSADGTAPESPDSSATAVAPEPTGEGNGEDGKPLVNWQMLEVPESVWQETLGLYDRVKTMRDVQNRQPVRMKHAILGALMFILCRSNGYPRTFVEICAAAKVTKREIGTYYHLMKRVLGDEFSSVQRSKPSEFLHRWCSVLDMPLWVAGAATKVHDRADRMGIVQGKCPISVSAASLWLVIWCFNHRHYMSAAGFALPKDAPITSAAIPNIPGLAPSSPAIPVTQRDVCKTARVVIATLTSVFKMFAPHIPDLVDGLMGVHL